MTIETIGLVFVSMMLSYCIDCRILLHLFFHQTLLICEKMDVFLQILPWLLRLRECQTHVTCFDIRAGTSLQRSPWIVASCWGSASDTNPWPRSRCTRSSSTTSSHMWKCPRLTSPRTHSPLSRLVQQRPVHLAASFRGDCAWTRHTVSFQDLLTRHKLLSAEFLEQHYDRVSSAQFMLNDFKKAASKIFTLALVITAAWWDLEDPLRPPPSSLL